MNVQLKVLVVVFGVVLLALLGRLIRRGRIRPEYSLFWLVGLAGATGLVVFDGLVARACSLLGRDVIPFSLLVLCALLFLSGICLHLSVRVSILKDQAVVLDQKAAHLELELSEMRRRLSP